MTEQPASTAPAAATYPLVKGRCPACNGSSLFLGAGGYVTCSRLDCPDPCAADDQLHRGRPAASGSWLLKGTRDLAIPSPHPAEAALALSDPPDDGPSVADCAADDQRWPLEKHGE